MDFMIGDNLRVLRAAKGVTQAEVAGQVGIAASTYASFERGDRPRALNEEKLEALAAYFGVPIAEILKKRAPKLAEESTAHDVAPGIPLRITLVGLGRINLGLMGPLFHRAGFEVCGVNLSHAGANRHLRTIDALRDKKHYVVREIDGRAENRRDVYVPLRQAFLFDEAEPDSLESRNAVKLAAHSHVLACGIGTEWRAREKCADFLHAVLKERLKNEDGLRGAAPVDICGCESPVGRAFSTAILRNRILDRIAADGKQRDALMHHVGQSVRFPLLLADRICAHRLIKEPEPVTIIAEPEQPWMLRASENSHYLRQLAQVLPSEVFSLSSDLEPYRLLKLNLFGCAHALAAYCGYFHGCKTIDQAVRRPAVRNLIDTALDDVAEALKRRGGLPEELIWAYRSRVLSRFANPLGDTLARVARDPLRKLARHDRLTGSALLVLYNCARLSRALAQGIAAAFAYAWHYDEQNRALWIEEDEVDEEACVLRNRLRSMGGTTPNGVLGLVRVLEQDCAVRGLGHPPGAPPANPVDVADPGKPIEWLSEASPAMHLEQLLIDEVRPHFERFAGIRVSSVA